MAGQDISLFAEKINHANCFSRAAFTNAAQRLGITEKQIHEYEVRLKEKGILITENVEWLTADQIDSVNKNYTL